MKTSVGAVVGYNILLSFIEKGAQFLVRFHLKLLLIIHFLQNKIVVINFEIYFDIISREILILSFMQFIFLLSG